MRSLYGVSTLRTSAFGSVVLDSHHTVLTESLARILRLLTHSMGDGSLAGLCQKNSSARWKPHSSHSRKSTRKLHSDRTGTPRWYAPPRSSTKLPVSFSTRRIGGPNDTSQSTYADWSGLPYAFSRNSANGGDVMTRSTDAAGSVGR